MPTFRFSRILKAARGEDAPDDTGQGAEGTEAQLRETQRRISELRQQIKRTRRELLRQESEADPSDEGVKGARRRSKKKTQQVIFPLRRELRAAKQLREKLRAREQRSHDPNDSAVGQVPVKVEAGALPDFVVIGEKKCGTTYLYDLLTRHPYVEPASSKELHFFDALFDEGIEWYRRCFPAPRWTGGRWTITGEATPYMTSGRAAERMAAVIPDARLIALLRDPVDRAYSDYQQVVSKEREPRTFEEAVADEASEYLTRSVYVDQLLHWSTFFPREQMLVLKSEDFFENPADAMKVVLRFLELPAWEAGEAEKRNEGAYTQSMNPATRRRLEEYFEPHNRRLYEYLGVDFGW